MKAPTLIGLTIASLLVTAVFYSQVNADDSFPPVKWVSKGSSDPISIQNGLGATLTILITVNPGGANINVSNCGNTTKINAGNSAICWTNDPSNSVTFSGDGSSVPASGTYQIKSQ